MVHDDETIAAIATPIGEGGISVIRVSGRRAFEMVDNVFRGKTTIKSARTHTAHYGYILDQRGEPVDEVVATVYRAPHSYSAEDSVEISCHGGLLVTRLVLEAILQSGARHAQPGEFTKRAFLNGRLDLSQAEAVADLIHSRSELSHKSSLHQLEGRLSKTINKIRGELLDASSLLELELDFAEEGIELTNKQEVSRKIAMILADLNGLIESFDYGKLYREGVKVVISGKPNVGKSSLLNALLNENRAIVTEIPGTTRDIIEENITIDGILFRLVDTAGLRESIDVVEKEGVRRSEAQIATSDLILLVFDLSSPFDNADHRLISAVLSKIKNVQDRCLLVFNKLDLVKNGQRELLGRIGLERDLEPVRVSAVTHEGLDLLKKVMVERIFSSKPPTLETSVLVTNVRHKEALLKATKHLKLALESVEGDKSGEFISLDLRAALDYLGEIVGQVTTDDILNNIFSKFCIGK